MNTTVGTASARGLAAAEDEGTFVAQGDAPASRPSPLSRTIRLLRLERNDIAVVVVYGVALGLLSLAVPIAVQSLVNTVAFGSLLQPLVVLTVLLAVALIAGAYLRALQVRVVEMLQRRLFVRVVSDLADRLPRVRADAFKKSHGPELLNRFFDVFTAQKMVAALLINGLDATLIALVGMIVLAFYHPALLAFDIALIIAAVVVFFLLGRHGIDSSVKESKAKYAVAGWLEEMARHPLSFKLAGGESFARQRVESLAATYLQRREVHFRVVFRQLVGTLGMQVAASVSLLAIGGFLVIERQLSLGQLVAAELIVTAVVASIAKLGGKVENYYDLLAAVDKLGEILDLSTEDTDDKEGFGPNAADILQVRDLEVRGDGSNPTRMVSFDVARGDAVILSGLSESDREAVSDALFGLRPAYADKVALGGFEQREVSLAAWRSRIALVRNEEVLPCSIAENLRAANGSLTNEQLWQLLDAVGLRRDVHQAPDRLETILDPSFANFAPSQALRMTVARALAAKPAVLILDGALDRIDPRERLATLDALRRTNVGLLILSNDIALQQYATTTIDCAPQGGEG